MGFLGPRVPASDFVAITGGPNDIGIGHVGQSESGFAAAHRVIPPNFAETTESETSERSAGPAHVSVVLHVCVEVVGNLVVDSDVIHLADWQLNAVEAAAVNGADVQAAVVG